ncbi:phosphate propanoyltransferase [Ammoniphilus sp. YIM 78166]|uniref:phosphate propanoyltransferase n=1 Tax=Ammoniphilus sp. YIM 78166 TaxID=1644106 RepID=UPI00106F34DB|nr:phosphate propanoyltransferase [Ammoniphilus sp. YIM 78166]
MIPVGISNRHIHVSEEDLFALFGEHYDLTNLKDLSQPGEFAAKETVTIAGPKGQISKVRILGPVRQATQLEISMSDSILLGIPAPIRMSGDLAGTPGIEIIGPQGSVKLNQGVIIAKRHIHMTPEDAKNFGVKDQEVVCVKTSGIRSLIFDQVAIRVSDQFSLEMHLDIDEANAAGLRNGDRVELIDLKVTELQLV